MYGQGNYASHLGQGPHTPMPPFQQRQPAPPLPHFQQGPPARPSIVQQASSTVPPHTGQLGAPIYRQGHPAPSPSVHQGAPSRMAHTSHPYIHPSPSPMPPVHGSVQFPHTYLTSQHNSQHHIPLPPPPPPLGHFRTPLPFGVLPPPPLPSQGNTLYRASAHPPQPQPGALPPPPPPPTSGPFHPSTFSSITHSTVSSSHMPTMVPPPPPPPPSSPPPIPPSPPPPTSLQPSHFVPCLAASDLPRPPNSDPSSNKVSGSEVKALDSDKEVGAPNQGGYNAIQHDAYQSQEVISSCEVGSLLRSSGMESSAQSDHLMAADKSHSLADSDMEMEDDITQPEKEPGVQHSIDDLNHGCVLIHENLDVNRESYATQNSADNCSAKGVLSEEVSCSRASGLGEQGKGSKALSDHAAFGSAGAAECPSSRFLEKSSTSMVTETINSDKDPSQLKGSSPFRLLQDYASDDSAGNDETCLENVGPVIVSPSVTAAATSLHRNTGSDLVTGITSESPCRTENGLGLLSETNMSYKAPIFGTDSLREVKDCVTTSVATETTEGLVNNNPENKTSINHAASCEAFEKKNGLGCGGIGVVPESDQSHEENAKFATTPLKVDEFGRLVRECASDSDSDHSRYTGRLGKRGRSWSRSRSPQDRRRRSPRRRREKRSRSRSWSPRNRRSKSRSPFRRRSEFGSDNVRGDKGKTLNCFDYLRGRCYRGASCRYLHHDSDKSSGSRHYRSKQQYLEVPLRYKNSNFHEENKNISAEVSDHKHDEVKSQGLQPSQEMSGSSFGFERGGNIDQKRNDSIRDSAQAIVLDQDGQLLDMDVIKSESSGDIAAQLWETKESHDESEKPSAQALDIEISQDTLETPQTFLVDSFRSQHASGADTLKRPGDTSQNVLSSAKPSVVQQSQSNLSTPVLQNANHLLLTNSSISDLSPEKKSIAFPQKMHASESFPNMISSTESFPGMSSMSQPFSSEQFSSQSLAHMLSPSSSAVDCPQHPTQLPPPPPLPLQGVNAPNFPQPPTDSNMVPQSAPFPIQPSAGESFPSYLLTNQQLKFSVSADPSWTSLPPPLPLPPPPQPYHSTVNARNATPGGSLQFQQTHMPSRSELGSQTFFRPYTTELPTHSQVGEFEHRAYPPVHLPASKPLNHQFGGASLAREDRFTQLPVQGLSSSNSFGQDNMHPHPTPFSVEFPANKMQHFPSENLHPGKVLESSSQSHPYVQQQHPSYGLQLPPSDGILSLPGKISSSSRYPPDNVDSNQPCHIPDYRASRFSTYFNPYASTFEQPLGSKFSSIVFRQENDASHNNRYETPFSLGHVQVDGQVVGSVGTRQTTCSPSFSRAVGHGVPRSGNDRYDPLFDSIEPSTKSFKELDHVQKKEVGAAALAMSLDNDEFGETADAEVGAVENGSPSNPMDIENMTAGDIEIDQIKSPGKSKKNKDSRSTKLFKIALADFVKEVLKPSWRQGIMSKEAFKTIVKKTIDKVSGAMKSHQIPKSQAKINHYIDSSQRKLTKLVLGYVDKYVKV